MICLCSVSLTFFSLYRSLDVETTQRKRETERAKRVEEAADEKKENTENEEGGGKQSWETAAAYIRRKNRERRIRNRTIGAPEEVLRYWNHSGF